MQSGAEHIAGVGGDGSHGLGGTRILADWRQLAGAIDSPLLGPEWTLRALQSFCAEPRLQIVESGGRLRSLIPVAAVRDRWCTRLEFPGASRLFEPADAVYADEAALETACRQLLDVALPVVLHRIPAEGPFHQSFRSMAKGRGLLRDSARSAAPVLLLEGDWESFLQGVSSRRRSDLRRAARKLEALGRVELEVHAPTAEQIDTLVDAFAEIEASGWKGRSGTALATSVPHGRFYRAFLRDMAADHRARVYFLSAGGLRVASMLAAEWNGRLWVLKLGYHEAHAKASPGTVLVWRVVEYAYAARLQAIEFLGVAEAWIGLWARQERRFASLAYYPFNLSGLHALVSDAVHPVFHRLAGAFTGNRDLG